VLALPPDASGWHRGAITNPSKKLKKLRLHSPLLASSFSPPCHRGATTNPSKKLKKLRKQRLATVRGIAAGQAKKSKPLAGVSACSNCGCIVWGWWWCCGGGGARTLQDALCGAYSPCSPQPHVLPLPMVHPTQANQFHKKSKKKK